VLEVLYERLRVGDIRLRGILFIRGLAFQRCLSF